MSLVYRNPASVEYTLDQIERDINIAIRDQDYIGLAICCITLYNGVINGADYAFHEMNVRLARTPEDLLKRRDFDQMLHLCVQNDLLEIHCVENSDSKQTK